MRREQLFAAFFLLAFCFLLYQFYRIISDFIGPLSYAALLAFIFYPLYRALLHRLGPREGLAAGLMTLAVVLLVIIPTFYVLALTTTESVALFERVSAFVRSDQPHEMMLRLRASWLGQMWLDLGPRGDALRANLPELAISASQTVSGFLVAQAPAAAANVLRFFVAFFFTVFAMFFFFRDGARMVLGVRDLVPMETAAKDAILARFSDTLSAVVLGSALGAFAQGLLAGIAFWALGVPFAVLLAGATAFFSLLPFVGPVVWVGVALYFLIDGDYLRATIMTGWGILVIGSADNFIRPLIIGGRTQIPTILLFFGILGGLQAYGFIGMFLGPAIIAIVVTFARIYREEYATDAPTAGPT
ncbi:MAG: AI-2E family transporter [Candidatus Binatia bacterium]